MANISLSQPQPTDKPRPIYSDYQFTQMRDVLVPLLLACPRKLMPVINHDIRQLFCDAGGALFGDKRRGWLLEDYAEFILYVKTGRYAPVDQLFGDMPRMALMWRGCTDVSPRSITLAELAERALSGTDERQVVRAAFEAEFRRWLSFTDKAHDYDAEILS